MTLTSAACEAFYTATTAFALGYLFDWLGLETVSAIPFGIAICIAALALVLTAALAARCLYRGLITLAGYRVRITLERVR